MTYDPGTDTVTTENTLTPDEQESLKVGTELQDQQEGLLAGKYKNAEELERAYGELERKLGEQDNQANETTNETEVQESDEVSEKEKETKEDSAVTTLMTDATTEFYDNNNTLSDETIEKFSEMSSTDLVKAYLEMQKNAQPTQQEVEDISEAEVNQVRNHVGGEAEYNKIVSWASENLPQSDVDAFDELVSTANIGAIKLAITGMKVEYQNANGYEGKMISGKPPQTSKDVFRSQPELVAAMSDPRYDSDPAYRQDVIEKLDRSDLNF